jgi:hypothetical protein
VTLNHHFRYRFLVKRDGYENDDEESRSMSMGWAVINGMGRNEVVFLTTKPVFKAIFKDI